MEEANCNDPAGKHQVPALGTPSKHDHRADTLAIAQTSDHLVDGQNEITEIGNDSATSGTNQGVRRRARRIIRDTEDALPGLMKRVTRVLKARCPRSHSDYRNIRDRFADLARTWP
eukprot:TRINITY_DN14599_c0_g1_i1.p1 TRINITY_DN14599_c0_g1~~TRINITY_DN14599_c0_g1_i1.p1  ORF type:complete len:116 (-),score=10.41 TRINITY_DN14599_c0_g1_i1:372-719(-)